MNKQEFISKHLSCILVFYDVLMSDLGGSDMVSWNSADIISVIKSLKNIYFCLHSDIQQGLELQLELM